MERARDWKRLFSRHLTPPADAPPRPEGAALELLPLAALRSEADRTGVAISTAAGTSRVRRTLDHAALLAEVARRTGEPDALLRAASWQARAAAEAFDDPALAAEALTAQARSALLTTELYGDREGALAARDKLTTLGAEGDHMRGLVQAAEALGAADLDAAIAAAGALDRAVDAAPTGSREAAEAALARADLLIGFGRRLRDAALLDRAARDLAVAAAALDPMLLPISRARADALRGQALVGLGELSGEGAVIAEGCAALADAAGAFDAAHSPLDTVRIAHALGLGLLALSEARDEARLAEQALAVLGPALEVLERSPELPLRAVVAHDRACALARRAIRRRDLSALSDAELLFRRELRARDARRDPVAWAVTQVALARIYEAQADMRGDLGERADAAVALAAALEVFTERGLKTLAEGAAVALGRLKAVA